MRKQEGSYQQYRPNLTINDEIIPALELGSSFKYLGKLFGFERDLTEEKAHLMDQLTSYLNTISHLNIKAQLKLKILRAYIPVQLNFDLRIYDFSYTWIEQNLDAAVVSAVNEWVELPNGTCTSEFLQLPLNKGGYGIPSLKSTAQKLRLNLRFALKHNADKDLRNIWELSSLKNTSIDSLLHRVPSKTSAAQTLMKEEREKAVEHIASLKIQGKTFNAVNDAFEGKLISKWSQMTQNILPSTLFTFVRKAFQQQLATAANLFRWKKTDSDKCPLCGGRQTNKHTLNNCASPSALARYKRRHDGILEILAQWITSMVREEGQVFVDLVGHPNNQIADIFTSLRPDIVVKHRKRISTLELTICHETNVIASRTYKQTKYKDLRRNLRPEYASFKISNYTIEITSLGIISDIRDFCGENLIVDQIPEYIRQLLFKTVISGSYSIYCLRNTV